MADEAELASRFSAERPLLQAWGEFVTTHVRDAVWATIQAHATRERFFRIRPEPRVKELDSFLGKALRRGKRYADPYNEITDRVATRFVVLLLPEILVVRHAVENGANWTWSRDRDFEEERDREPLLFQYQSVHYIVRARQDRESAAGVIPEGMPCEVQIRTLLQHAYGELSHETVYKPAVRFSPPEVIREVARSMALIETTDMAFERASRIVEAREAALRADLAALAEQYHNATGAKSEDSLPLAFTIFESVRDITPQPLGSTIEQFRATHPYIDELVRERRGMNQIYSQAIVLLLYYLIDRYRSDVLDSWPLPQDELAPLFSDLGIALQ